MIDGANKLAEVCRAVEQADRDRAVSLLTQDYPFIPLENIGRHYTALECMRVFIRDGFIDRYSGKRLIFPATLRALSLLFPAQFPFHPNWKTDACHFAYYELSPTIDHIVPVSRGGADARDNWVTTSMLTNAAKGNFLVEELGWHILPPGNLEEWDGLTKWFFRQDELANFRTKSSSVRNWAEAARKAFAEVG